MHPTAEQLIEMTDAQFAAFISDTGLTTVSDLEAPPEPDDDAPEPVNDEVKE